MAKNLPWSKRNGRREAMKALSTMVGAVVLARAVDDPELSDEILAQAKSALLAPTRD